MHGTQSQERPAAEAVRATRCTLCAASPGVPCTAAGDHLGRWLAACSARAITRDDLKQVIVRLTVVTRWCVVALYRCQECGGPAPEGNDMCGRCENAAAALTLAVFREIAAERGE